MILDRSCFRLRSLSYGGQVAPRKGSPIRTYYVVPAKAGTHSHRRSLAQKVSASAPKMTGHGVWVPAFAGTTWEDSIFKEPTSNTTSRSRGAKRARVVHLSLAHKRPWGLPGARCPHTPACEVGSAHGSSPQCNRDHP